MAKSIQEQAREIVDSYLEGNSIDDEGLVEAIASALREVAREQREQQKEADAVLMCSMCSTVASNPNRILVGPAEFRGDVWGHWFNKGDHAGTFAGHCMSAAIRIAEIEPKE